jgi:hypothetical protein
VTDGAGVLTRNNVGSTAKVFPIGDATYYTPVTLTNSGSADNFSVAFAAGTPSCMDAATALAGTWNIAEAVDGGSNCTISIDFGSVPEGGSYNAGSAKIGHCGAGGLDFVSGSVSGSVATGSGFTAFSPYGVTTQAALPIELISLNAQLRNRQTYLDWSTATERDNAFFSVERSNDGTDFRAIGRVDGAINSNTTQRYNFVDKQPLTGINFYRLKQVDLNGDFSYSKVVAVTVDATGHITLSPVPAQDQLTVQLETAQQNEGFWQVFDNTGHLVQTGTIPAEANNFNVQVAELAAGTYVLRLVDGQTVLTKRFVK